jgi:uncharacterized protein
MTSNDDDFLIHPDRLATKPTVFAGTFKPAELERLEDAVANGEGEVRYRISAGLDKQRRKVVSCIIEGFVFLLCQNTLDQFRHEISITDVLILVDHENELPGVEAESETEDYLVADAPLDIRDLIEDAILLALPMVPRKPGQEEVKDGGGGGGKKPSPFAVLASLKKDS